MSQADPGAACSGRGGEGVRGAPKEHGVGRVVLGERTPKDLEFAFLSVLWGKQLCYLLPCNSPVHSGGR